MEKKEITAFLIWQLVLALAVIGLITMLILWYAADVRFPVVCWLIPPVAMMAGAIGVSVTFYKAIS